MDEGASQCVTALGNRCRQHLPVVGSSQRYRAKLPSVVEGDVQRKRVWGEERAGALAQSLRSGTSTNGDLSSFIAVAIKSECGHCEPR